MSDCIFCQIVSGEIPSQKIYEDDEVLAFLDITPVNPGHTLVVPKKHYADFLALSEDLAFKIVAVIKKITPAILRGVGADSFNLGLNNGALAGQAVNHFHWHIMPRFDGDGYELWRGKQLAKEELEEVKNKIVKNL